MVKIINDYTDSMKEKLLNHMLQQRTIVNEHTKEIGQKINEIESIISGVEAVE